MPKRTELRHDTKPVRRSSEEDRAWLDMTPVGREFGSPDYERLTALDDAAFAAFQSWKQARHWLAAPNAQLDGASPEDVARSPDGLLKVMSILATSGGKVSEDFLRAREEPPVQERESLQGLTSGIPGAR